MGFVPVGIDENSDLPQEARERLVDTIAVPAGGTTGQALVKASGTDHDDEWADVVLSDGNVTNIVSISRTDYDLLSPPVATTLYVIDETS